MFPNMAQAFWACLMLLSWSGLFALELNEAVKEYIDGEEIDEEGFRKEVAEYLEQFRRSCDEPVCNELTCDQGGAPPFCPRNVTFCRSGCACINYCKDPTRKDYCYEVKYCRIPRLFTPDTFFTTPEIPLDF